MPSFFLQHAVCLLALLWLTCPAPLAESEAFAVSIGEELLRKDSGSAALHTPTNAVQNFGNLEFSESASLPRRVSRGLNNQECGFASIQAFFDFANKERLNITTEVQSCQNLCLLIYGTGNPDLSGIGMMHAYNVQGAGTVLFGPMYRLLQISNLRYGNEGSIVFSFFSELQAIQALFFASNGFFILSSAVASLVRLGQNPSIFEIAEMQALAFFQLNSLLVTFFCLAQPISRWVARLFFVIVVLISLLVVLGKSQLSSSKRKNWRLASEGCEHRSSDFGVITPTPYPPSAVILFAAAGVLCLWLRSIKSKFQGNKRKRLIFDSLMSLWVLLIGLMTAGTLFGLVMVWRQRQHLRTVVGEEFQDDIWGFGQVAALFIYMPVPVELLLAINETSQKKYPKWDQLMKKGISFSFKSKSNLAKHPGSSDPQAREKGQSDALGGTTA